MDIRNLSIIRQNFAQVVFTHKVQEVAADSNSIKASNVKRLNILLSALSLISLITSNFSDDKNWIFYFGILIGIAEITFLIFQLFFNFEQRVVAHKNAALQYLGLRDDYSALIVDAMNEDLKGDALISQRDFLRKRYQIICNLSPQTSDEDYEKAQIKLNKRGVKEGEEFTWSDKEIDRFLPENLRIKS